MNIFKLEFRSTLKSLILWSSIVSVILILFMLFFPSMSNSDMQQLTHAKLDAMPKAVLEAFGLTEMPDFTNIIEYFAYMFQFFILAGAIYAALLGASSLIKEESDGTIEYLYAQPVTRTQIVTQKLLAAVCSFLVFICILGAVSALLLTAFKPADADLMEAIMDMKLIFSGMLLSGLVFLSVSFFISTLLKSAKQAMPLALGFVFGTYLLGILSKTVSDSVAFAKIFLYFSPLDYGMPSALLSEGFKTKHLILAFAIIAASIAATYMIYQRKDLKS